MKSILHPVHAALLFAVLIMVSFMSDKKPILDDSVTTFMNDYNSIPMLGQLKLIFLYYLRFGFYKSTIFVMYLLQKCKC